MTFAKAFLETHRDTVLADYFEFLRFASVGVDPARYGECVRCTGWLRRYVKAMGFDVEIVAPEGGVPPVLFAERSGAPGAPVVLVYGHYDVQPEDPVAEWHSAPFEPELRGNRVYARGAQDDKGQLFAFLQGVRAVIAAGGKLPTLRLMLEGQEECGSPGTLERLDGWRERLRADILMVIDTGMHASGRPAIVAGLRGVMSLGVRLRGAAYDLHSGTHGGIAPNAAQALAELAASLHDANGRIAVEGFLQGVSAPSDAERAELAREPFDPAAYAASVGVAPVGGETGIPPELRAGFLPTLEINGLHAGYAGPGGKTIIPSEGVLKLSARLTPGQSPRHCMEALQTHLKNACPRGMQLTFEDVHEGAPGFRLGMHSPVFRLAHEVLEKLDPRGPVMQWEGASIPVVGRLREISGAAPLLVGFGREEDRIHSPNESFGLDQFEMAAMYAAGMMNALVAG